MATVNLALKNIVCLHLVPLCKVRECFSACSFCLSASSSLESFFFSSAERAWPALTKASGVCKERKQQQQNPLKQRTARTFRCALPKWIFLSNLVSEHKGDDFQHMHTPLLLTLCWGQELDQVIKAAHVNGPQHSIMDTGIIIHFLQIKDKKREIRDGKNLQSTYMESA